MTKTETAKMAIGLADYICGTKARKDMSMTICAALSFMFAMYTVLLARYEIPVEEVK